MRHLKIGLQSGLESYFRLLMIVLFLLSVTHSTSQASPLSEQVKFDDKGRVLEKISLGGTKTRFKYNEQGLPVEIKYPKGFVRYVYDQNGNRTWLENEQGKTEYVYDAFERLTQVVSHYGPVKTVRFEYDPWNRISLIEILEKNKIIYKISYEYDLLGNITLVDGGVGKITYEYDLKKGSVIRVFPNGVKSIFLYSSLGELISLEHKDSKNLLIASYQYDYDIPGRISRVIEKIGGEVTTRKYEWNKRGFLGKAHFSDGNSIQYRYDTMGRLLSANNLDKTYKYKYDTFGRLLSAGKTRFKRGKEGKVVSQKANSGRTRFRYDGRNLPALVIAPDTIIRYRWDGDGNLVSKRVGKEVRHYLSNPLAPAGFTLAEFDNKGHLKASYLYDGLDLIGVHEADGYKFTLGDGLGHIRHTVDPRGKIKAIGSPEMREIKFPLIFEYRRSGRRRDRLVKAFLNNRQHSKKEIQNGDRYWSEGLYWDDDPYYKMIRELDEAPDLGDIGTFVRVRYFETPGLILSHWIRQASIGTSFVDPTPISSFISAFSRRSERFFGNALADREGGDLVIGQFEGFQKNEDRVSRISSVIGLTRNIHTVWQKSHEKFKLRFNLALKINRVYFGLGGLAVTKQLFKTTQTIRGKIFNPLKFFTGTTKEFIKSRFLGDIQNKIGGGSSYYKTAIGQGKNKIIQKNSVSNDDDECKDSNCDDRIGDNDSDLCFFCRGPDSGPGGGSSGGGFPGYGPSDFFKKMEVQLGGIDLSAEPLPAEDLKIGRLKALVYDRKGERLVLVGDEELEIPSIRIGDLAEALDIVSRPDCTPRHQCPAFTLEPAEKKYPDSPAALIGITSGDVLVSFNNARIRGHRGLLNELKAIAHDLSRKLENRLKKNKKSAGSIFIYKNYPIKFVRDKKEFKDQITIQINKPYKYKTLKDSQLLEQMLGIVLNYSEKVKTKGLLVKSVKGEMLVKDYIPDWIEEKEIGRIMFVSDWLLKEYSFGVKFVKGKGKNTLEQKERNSDVEGYLSATDISLLKTGANSQIASNRQESRNRLLQWMSERLKKKCPQLKMSIEDLSSKSDERMRARMWIEVKERRVNLHRYNDSVWVDEPNMIVKAMRQEHDPQRGLYDVESDNPVSKAFAKEFTCFYDDFSQDSDSGYYGASIDLYRLKEYTKALAIARWLKDLGFKNQEDWIKRSIFKKKTDLTLIRAILTKKKFGKIEYFSGYTNQPSVRYFGGVDLRVAPNYIRDGTKISPIEKVVLGELEKGISGKFRFTANGTKYAGVVVSLKKPQQKEMLKVREVNGIRYEMSENGKIIKSVSPDGSMVLYGYDPVGSLNTVEIQNQNGWELHGERSATGSIWTATNPRDNTFTSQYDASGDLKRFEVNGKKWADYRYDKKKRQMIVQYDKHIEKINYHPNGKVKAYEVHHLKDNTRDRLRFTYSKAGNLTRMWQSDTSLIKISYQKGGKKPASVASPLSETKYAYDRDGNIRKIRHSSGLSTTYDYKDKQLREMQVAYNGKQAESLFDENGMIQSRGFDGEVTRYNYSEGKISTVALGEYGKIEYDYDDTDRILQIRFPDGKRIEYQYKKKKKSENEYILKAIFHPSSVVRTTSPVVSKETTRGKVDSLRKVLEERLKDDLTASKDLINGLIIDHYRDQEGLDHVNIIDSSGEFHKLSLSNSKELRWLINTTAKTSGLYGSKLSSRWKRFYNEHLRTLVEPSELEILGKKVKKKPRLIIRSNEVNYKYANLEKVPELKDNYIISISQQDSVSKLVKKTISIPKLTTENTIFAIRLPEMPKTQKHAWMQKIEVLKKKMGENNVLFDPSKKEFENMLKMKGKDVIVFELTHMNKGIVLRDGERYDSKDVLRGGDLSHIKYLITGGGCCQLPLIEDGNFTASLREKGVGLINVSYRDVPNDIALKRLGVFLEIINEIERHDLPSDYVLDIIDQILGISNKGTTNLGKNDLQQESALG